MDRSEEIALIKEVIGLAEQRSAYLDKTISHSPIERYCDPARFAAETRAVFARQPVVAGRSDSLADPNSFLTLEMGGRPLLVTRDGDGTLRAFLNICRHRGAKLEREARGCKRVFTCPYHGWAYSSTGALRGVPHERQGFPELDREGRGLRELAVAERHGFIWVIADHEAETTVDLDDWLGRLNADLAWLGLAQHRVAVAEDFEVKANWKLLIEGGLEAYHFRVAHAATIGPYFPDNLSTYQMFGPHIRSVLPRSTMPDLRDAPEDSWSIRAHANLLYTLAPTTQLLVQHDHVGWLQMVPLNEGLTRVHLATLVPEDAPRTEAQEAHWQKNQAITRATIKEDFDLGEEIQAGFASRGNPSHLFGRFEGALNRFNLAIEAML
jgi:phenylpropionate dioxygenase-like ring-hydroxylating dioxygenase large terminal subunit